MKSFEIKSKIEIKKIKIRKNGILFEPQSAKALAEAILKFEKMKFDREKVSKTVDNFGVERFDKELVKFVKDRMRKNEKD